MLCGKKFTEEAIHYEFLKNMNLRKEKQQRFAAYLTGIITDNKIRDASFEWDIKKENKI